MFNDRLWTSLNSTRADVHALQYSESQRSRNVTELDHELRNFMRMTERHLKILDDSISIIARTLDANNIKEACQHCGQVKESV